MATRLVCHVVESVIVDVPRDGWPGGTIAHLCDRGRRKTDAKLVVSNEYLSCRFGYIIEPNGFIINKHNKIMPTYIMQQPS